MSSTLRETQRTLQDLFTQRNDPQEYPEFLAETAPIPIGKRVHIYRHGYRARPLDALRANFESSYRLLTEIDRLDTHSTESRFDNLVQDYLEAHPSTHFNITAIGDHLEPFVRQHPLGKSVPYLADLIKLEWKLLQKFFTPTPVQPFEEVPDSGPFEDLLFIFDPALEIVSFKWPVVTLWQSLTQNELQVPAQKTPEVGLLYRTNIENVDAVSFATDDLQIKIIRRLKQGFPLGKACRDFLPESQEKIAQWTGNWKSVGLIQSIEVCRSTEYPASDDPPPPAADSASPADCADL